MEYIYGKKFNNGNLFQVNGLYKINISKIFFFHSEHYFQFCNKYIFYIIL